MKKSLSIFVKLLTLTLCLMLVFGITVSASEEANEGGEENLPGAEISEEVENTEKSEEISPTSPENLDDSNPNLFDEVYSLMEENADKIFAILAFLGTLVVGIGYKSNLLPLLRDALSKLKSSIDKVKEDGDKNSLTVTEKVNEINLAIDEINDTLSENQLQLSRIKWQFENYDELLRERDCMKALIEGQIDLLYSVFMYSSLPQYQKDEIGERIRKMREELFAYESKKN